MILLRRLSPLCVALTFATSVSHAQTPPQVPAAQPAAQTPTDPTAEARVHFDRGLALFNQQNFEGALAEFRRAYDLSHRVNLLYNLGATYQSLHRYPEAATAIEEYLRRAENLPPAQRTEVQTALDQIRGFIAHVTVRVVPTDAAVTLDDEPIAQGRLAEPIPVGPGRHTISASAQGRLTGRTTFEIASGDTRNVELRLEELPAVSRATSLEVRGAPQGATVDLDGRSVVATAPIVVTPGAHRLSVRAQGSEPWSGEVTVPEGATRVVSVRLGAARGLRPGVFIATSVATGVFAAATVSLGLLTLSERSNFDAYTSRTAEALASADRGTTYRLVTNIMLGATVASAIASVILLTQTRFGRTERSTVEFSATPLQGGAAGGLNVRF